MGRPWSHLSRWQSALFVSVVLASGVVLAADTVRDSVELFPGALVDDRGDAILVMEPGSAIAVLDRHSGLERCRTPHAARPLLLRGDRLLAQTESGANRLRLQLFDYRRSEAGCELSPVRQVELELPHGVRTLIDERIDAAFDLRARPAGDRALVTWTYRDSPAYPDSFAERGSFLIDLASGEVASTPETVPPAPARALPPVPGRPARRVESASGPVSIEVVLRSDRSRAVVLDRAGGGPTESLEVTDARALWLSSDEALLLVATHLEGAPIEQRYQWSLFSIDDGRARGSLRARRSGAPFVVRGSTLIYREGREAGAEDGEGRPARLVAVEMDGERRLWSHVVRDTAYRGTRPPRQPQHGAPRLRSASKHGAGQ